MNDPASVRLQPVKLGARQIKQVRDGYASGDIQLQVLMNVTLFTPGTFLGMLPCAPLSPCHFLFTGKRRYRMQLVTNGEMFGFLTQSWTRTEPGMASLEVVRKCDLPFMQVTQEPTIEQLQALQADVIERAVVFFGALDLTPEDRDGYKMLYTPSSGGNETCERLLATPHQAREILAAHEASTPSPRTRFYKGPSAP